jgi:hypothetical protein
MPATFTGARVKISELPSITLPMSGTEEVPNVQAGQTRKAEVQDLPDSGLVPGSLFLTGVATDALAAGTNDNLATDISAASRLALTLAGDATLTGLAGGSDGKVLSIQNRDAVDTLTIMNEGGTSVAANRFAINGDLIVPPLCGALFVYDGTIQRWVKQ